MRKGYLLLGNLSLPVVPLLLVLSGWLLVSTVFAGQGSADEAAIDWLQLAMGLFGGLALFLAGLEVLSEGLKLAAGNTLRTLLQKLTVNRFLGSITGAIVSGVLNPSSVTTVLVVGFVTAGVMTLSQSVGVLMGANIGSTVTAQILAFNLSAYALIPAAVGFFLYFSAKTDRVKYAGIDDHGPGAGLLRHGPDERGDEAAAHLRAVHGDACQDGEPDVGHPDRRRFRGPGAVVRRDRGYRHRHGQRRIADTTCGNRIGAGSEYRYLRYSPAGGLG
jgi:hypothetical protein